MDLIPPQLRETGTEMSVSDRIKLNENKSHSLIRESHTGKDSVIYLTMSEDDISTKEPYGYGFQGHKFQGHKANSPKYTHSPVKAWTRLQQLYEPKGRTWRAREGK